MISGLGGIGEMGDEFGGVERGGIVGTHFSSDTPDEEGFESALGIVDIQEISLEKTGVGVEGLVVVIEGLAEGSPGGGGIGMGVYGRLAKRDLSG